MSIVVTTQVECDKCRRVASAAATHIRKPLAREARKLAKADGWKPGKKRDLCKSCVEELDKAVKTLLAAS